MPLSDHNVLSMPRRSIAMTQALVSMDATTAAGSCSGSQAGEQEAPSLFGCPANVDNEGTEVVYAGVAERGSMNS